MDAEIGEERGKERAESAHFLGNPSAYAAKIETIKSLKADDLGTFADHYLGLDRAPRRARAALRRRRASAPDRPPRRG